MSRYATNPRRSSRLQSNDWGQVQYGRPEPESRGSVGYVAAGLMVLALVVLCGAAFFLLRVMLPNSPPAVLPAFITQTASAAPDGPGGQATVSPSPGVGSKAALLTLDPTQGFVNTLINVSGEGWWPNEPVFVFLRSPDEGEGRGFAYAAAVADDRGSFRTALTFPNEIRWIGQPWAEVIARGNRSDIAASARFELVAPTATPTLPPPTPRPTEPPTATPSVTDTPWPTATPLPSPTPAVVITEWRGEYFANPSVVGDPLLVRNDVTIDFSWGTGSPSPAIPVDGFSARWTRVLQFAEGSYRFTVRSDDGVRFWIDGRIYLDEWHDSPGGAYSFDLHLTGGMHALQLDYYENLGAAMVQATWQEIQPPTPTPVPSTPTATAPPPLEAWLAEYYANPSLDGGPALTRQDAEISFDWGYGSPADGIPVDGFSARWTREVWIDSGLYRFYLEVDDGARVWLDDRLLIDEWHGYTGETYVAHIEVPSGTHRMRVEYYENIVLAHIRFWMERVQ